MFVHELNKMAKQIRRDIINTNFQAESTTHPAPALSCTDILTALYFHIMKIDPSRPDWPERDRFIISKGHAYLGYYATLARRGYFPVDWLRTVRAIDSKLQGHPDMKKTPGVDMTSGSLGNGLSIGAGMALYAKAKDKSYRTYVLIGDGESQEGAIWEAALTAAAQKLNNLICIVDCNQYQSCGAVDEIVPMDPLEDKWRAFGWDVLSMNGNNMSDIVNKLDIARNSVGRPVAIIARTVKGKGISFMEHDNQWHSKQVSKDEYNKAIKELEEVSICE